MIELNRLRKDELDEFKIIRDSCLEFLNEPTSFTLTETEDWFVKFSPEYYSIRVNDRDRMAGYIRTSRWNANDRSMYIGLDLHPDFRGYGYAFQSYQKIMEELTISKQVRRFYLEVRVSNFRAYNLYSKLGFKSIGVIPNAIASNEGFVDVILMYKDNSNG